MTLSGIDLMMMVMTMVVVVVVVINLTNTKFIKDGQLLRIMLLENRFGKHISKSSVSNRLLYFAESWMGEPREAGLCAQQPSPAARVVISPFISPVGITVSTLPSPGAEVTTSTCGRVRLSSRLSALLSLSPIPGWK